MESPLKVKRGYIDVESGQIHFRYAGQKGRPTITLFHASPGSSRQLNNLISELAESFFVYAPDTPGNGLSDPLPIFQPEIADFAYAHLQALKSLKITDSILFGTHTGASIAAALSQLRGNPATLLVLDSVGFYDHQEKEALLQSYAPQKHPLSTGEHLLWTWHFIRDQWLFWPWYKHTAPNRLARGLPEISYLHGMCIDVLESLETYHLSYNAAFRFDKEACFDAINCPTIIASDKEDMLFKYFARLKEFIPNSRQLIHEGWQKADRAKSTAELFKKMMIETEEQSP